MLDFKKVNKYELGSDFKMSKIKFLLLSLKCNFELLSESVYKSHKKIVHSAEGKEGIC